MTIFNKIGTTKLTFDSDENRQNSFPSIIVDSIGRIIALYQKILNNVEVYCAGSTHTVPLNVTAERKREELGLTTTVIVGQNTADASIGLW
jgi:hypothetical protein